MSLVVRRHGDPYAMLPAIRREIAVARPALALYDIRTLEQVVARSLSAERFATWC